MAQKVKQNKIFVWSSEKKTGQLSPQNSKLMFWNHIQLQHSNENLKTFLSLECKKSCIIQSTIHNLKEIVPRINFEITCACWGLYHSTFLLVLESCIMPTVNNVLVQDLPTGESMIIRNTEFIKLARIQDFAQGGAQRSFDPKGGGPEPIICSK